MSDDDDRMFDELASATKGLEAALGDAFADLWRCARDRVEVKARVVFALPSRCDVEVRFDGKPLDADTAAHARRCLAAVQGPIPLRLAEVEGAPS